MNFSVIFKKLDVDVLHEGYVRHHWLDYDETWRNDAFLQDIFTVTLTDTPVNLTQGAMLDDPGETPLQRTSSLFLLFQCFKGKSNNHDDVGEARSKWEGGAT